MKLPELKKLVDDWVATDDWNDTEVCVFNSNGEEIKDSVCFNLEAKASCEEDERDVLIFDQETKCLVCECEYCICDSAPF